VIAIVTGLLLLVAVAASALLALVVALLVLVLALLDLGLDLLLELLEVMVSFMDLLLHLLLQLLDGADDGANTVLHRLDGAARKVANALADASENGALVSVATDSIEGHAELGGVNGLLGERLILVHQRAVDGGVSVGEITTSVVKVGRGIGIRLVLVRMSIGGGHGHATVRAILKVLLLAVETGLVMLLAIVVPVDGIHGLVGIKRHGREK